LLATNRLNVNHTVRKKLGARKVSFASAEETQELTGMEMQCKEVILGGGNRSSKLRVETTLFHSLPNVEIVAGLTID